MSRRQLVHHSQGLAARPGFYWIWICLISLASSASIDAQVALTSSHYIPMPDKTLIAADVHLPRDRASHDKHPALIELTRYWRSSENAETGEANPSLSPLDRFFLRNGYAVIKVDVRGSGASFGSRPVEYGPQEVLDGYAIVDWVVHQNWSDGNVGAYGTSYSGTTAELLAATGHPAVKAVIPGWSDFEIYRSPARPYGLLASFIDDWGSMVGALDRNDASTLGASVRRVDGDDDGSMRNQAVAEHQNNPDVYAAINDAPYWDDALATGITYGEIGPLHWREKIEAAQVPMLILVSWLDAGTIEGAMQRLKHFSNPQKLIILASSHGGRLHASPFEVSGSRVEPKPSMREQGELRLAFFDYHLRGRDNRVKDWPRIRYYNMGEEAYRESEVWPPGKIAKLHFFLNKNQSLTSAPPDQEGQVVYWVDFAVSTGRNNRWYTQMGQAVLNLDNRGAMDDRMATFTSDVLQNDLQITGNVIIRLRVSSDRKDGALLVYLEDVDEKGQSRYLTEGGIRLIHRKVASENGLFEPPHHTYLRSDAMAMEPGRIVEVQIKLWATSVLVQKGHRVQVAIAGADAGTVDRIPEQGEVNLSVHWSKSEPSLISLPVVVKE